MRPLRIELDDAALDSCTPQVQEALLRIARMQSPENFPSTDTRTANERLREGLRQGQSEKEFEAQRSRFSRPDGMTIIEKPNITPRR